MKMTISRHECDFCNKRRNKTIRAMSTTAVVFVDICEACATRALAMFKDAREEEDRRRAK
jgi:transcription elongation factor Elf1